MKYKRATKEDYIHLFGFYIESKKRKPKKRLKKNKSNQKREERAIYENR